MLNIGSLLIKEMCRKSFCKIFAKIYYLISITFQYYYIFSKRFTLQCYISIEIVKH